MYKICIECRIPEDRDCKDFCKYKFSVDPRILIPMPKMTYEELCKHHDIEYKGIKKTNTFTPGT